MERLWKRCLWVPWRLATSAIGCCCAHASSTLCAVLCCAVLCCVVLCIPLCTAPPHSCCWRLIVQHHHVMKCRAVPPCFTTLHNTSHFTPFRILHHFAFHNTSHFTTFPDVSQCIMLCHNLSRRDTLHPLCLATPHRVRWLVLCVVLTGATVSVQCLSGRSVRRSSSCGTR